MLMNMLQFHLVLNLLPVKLVLLRLALGVLGLCLLINLHGDALVTQSVLSDLKELVFP